MKYHVIRIMDNDEQQNTRLVYAHAEDGENEILELGIDWMEKNEVDVGSWLITDEKGYIRKYEEEKEIVRVGERDEFKNCVIRALLDNYDAKCELANMLLESNDYDRNKKAAFTLIEQMYSQIRTFSENNFFKDDFCDIAVRYGDLFYDGIGIRKNKMSAYKCYLEALTIYNSCRSNIEDFDGRLYERIKSRIERYESEKDSFEYNRIVTRSFVCNYPFFLMDVLSCGSNKYRVDVKLTQITSTDYMMKLVRVGASGSGNNNLVPRFLISIPEQELCVYSRTLKVMLRGTTFLGNMNEQFMADSFLYDQNSEELTFILNDEEVMKAKVNYMEIESD
ncbi:MAG: hypothetical protein IKN54_02075 [Lachnospiraceae bacterium]|nr:hypothetical protein [Lachnospiraceae bacterium]